MHIGIMMFSTDQTVQPAELARMIEARGFEAMFLPEHSHIPASRVTPYPRGGDLPPEYFRTHDAFVGLAAAAVAAPSLTIGTGVTIVAQHDPITLAKSVASLDHVAQGRFVLGIGFGWNRDEMEDHGVIFMQRREMTREKILAMRELWTKELAHYEGEYVRFPPSYLWPKPVQPGGPPVVVGGAAGPKLFAHISAYADGWAPIGPRTIMEGLPNLQRAFEQAGRDPADIRLHAFDPRAEPGLVEHYASLGVERLVLNIDPLERGELERALDEMAPLNALVAESQAAV